MGRWNTGALTTGEAKRIELKYMFDRGMIKAGCEIHRIYSWTCSGKPSGQISIISRLDNGNQFIRLVYTITDRETGESTNYDYKTYLEAVPSNLGKGVRYYFICPVSGKRAMILYMAYGYDRFKHREAYQNRLYYKSQIRSKRDRAGFIYESEEEIKNLYNAQKKSHYQGKPTKLQQRIDRALLKEQRALLGLHRLVMRLEAKTKL